MALSNRINMRGGGNTPTQFPWDAKTEGAFNQTQGTATSGNTVTFQTSIASPKIESGCHLKCITSSVSLQTTLYVSTDGTTWTQVAQGSGQPVALDYPLTNYIGQQVYIRAIAKNTDSTTHVITLSSCVIEKV